MTDVNQSAETALRMVREAPLIAYDTETSGTDWKKNFPVGYVVATGWDSAVYVPVRHGGGGSLPDAAVRVPQSPTDPYVQHRFEKELADAFVERNRLGFKTIGHHVKFDCHMSANAGIMLGRNLIDTQINEALLDEHAKQYSLEACAKRRNVTHKRSQEMYDHLGRLFGIKNSRESMSHFWRTSGDDPMVVEYSVGDGISTFELFEAQTMLIEEEELTQVWEMECQLIWTLFRMERRGIRVDVEYLERTKQYIEEQVELAIQSLPPGLNVRSGPQLRKYFEDAGHTDWPETDKGNPSFTEKWLKTHEPGQKVVKVRKWTHMNNSFITPLLEEHVFNGRVHANINQLKNDDYGSPARLSCSNPNLMAVPKRDKELAPLFRKGFIADDGYTYFEDDYSQCEPCLFAHYSRDERLLEGYNSTPRVDVHDMVAKMLEVDRDTTAKRMNMGIFTGMQPNTFAVHMGWDVGLATEKWNQWFETFPGVKDFQREAKQAMLDRGWVRTLLKRRGRLEHPRWAYKAVSQIIQGGNADILKWALLKVDLLCEAEGDVLQVLMTIHDAFEGQYIPNEYGRKLRAEMNRIMLDVQSPPFNLRVPFAVDSGEGPDWAVASFGDKHG